VYAPLIPACNSERMVKISPKIAACNSERMVKIGAELPTLSKKLNWVSGFLDHPVCRLHV